MYFGPTVPIGPINKNIPMHLHKRKICMVHLSIAILVLACISVNSYLFVEIYSEFIHDYNVVLYILVAFAILSAISMLVHSINIKNKYTQLLVALSELLCILTFGIFLILFILQK